MVGTESASVLERPVEIKGGHPIGSRRHPTGHVCGRDASYYAGGGFYVGWSGYTSGTAIVELKHNPDGHVETVGFDTHDEARAEFERIKGEIFTRQWVTWVTTKMTEAGAAPDEFREQFLAGELQTLLVAADWQHERDRPNAALILRAAYHRIRGEANVEVKAGKGVTVVLNPEEVTKRTPAAPHADGSGFRAVVVEAGKSVRVVSLLVEWDVGQRRHVAGIEERTFRIGDQAEYDSFNLTYYGPVQSITAKTVVVVTDRYRDGATARLTIARFADKNHNFDLAKAQKRNANWSD